MFRFMGINILTNDELTELEYAHLNSEAQRAASGLYRNVVNTIGNYRDISHAVYEAFLKPITKGKYILIDGDYEPSQSSDGTANVWSEARSNFLSGVILKAIYKDRFYCERIHCFDTLEQATDHIKKNVGKWTLIQPAEIFRTKAEYKNAADYTTEQQTNDPNS